MTDDIEEVVAAMLPSELHRLNAALEGYELEFEPNAGPQTMAYNSEADIVGFGGAAGGGKSMLGAGLAVSSHKRSLIVRQEKVTTRKFVQELTKMRGGDRSGYSSQGSTWSMTTNDGEQRLIEFAGLDNEGDEEKQQGVDYDLKVYDEVTQQRESQVRYTMGWVRSDSDSQRTRVLLTFNPPTTAEGRWVIKFFKPWLDPKHPNPAKDGELRWFITRGKDPDFEWPDNRPFVWRGAAMNNPDGDGTWTPVHDYAEEEYQGEKQILVIKPKSRTFITSRVTDNPYYVKSGYIGQLQALPEPLRSQMLHGDFGAGVEDAQWQVIPTAWIEAAMDRWYDPETRGPMDSMGVDAARGGNMGSTFGATGNDKMVISRRHGTWFAPLIRIEGVDCNSGPLAAAHVVKHRRDHAPVHIDIIGVGTSPYDFLIETGVHTIPVNNAAGYDGADRSGLLKFVNKRAALYWMMREALDPDNAEQIMLPDDAQLLADLAAATYRVTKSGIQIESKEELKKRLGRSPDDGDAVIMANITTPKRKTVLGALDIDALGIYETPYDQSRFDELKG